MTQAKWFVVAGMAVLWAAPACAVGTPAERAAELLARARAVDAKCHYLQGQDQDALSHLVARAELALANQVSVDDTKATMARGRAAGAAAPCNAAEKANVNSILGQAQHSADQNPQEEATVATQPDPVAPRQPIINQFDAQVQPPKRQPIIRGAWNNNDQSGDQPQPSPMAGDRRLANYGMMTENYFVALRCGGHRGPSLGNLYQNIRASHDDLMQNHAPQELSVVLRRAKMRAASRGCLF